ncbi:hypothetical protein BLOT_000177 [Blomia tropicalis]|nr:hypothetical protein BLOT_000177 [Blomia tropicalis]
MRTTATYYFTEPINQFGFTIWLFRLSRTVATGPDLINTEFIRIRIKKVKDRMKTLYWLQLTYSEEKKK